MAVTTFIPEIWAARILENLRKEHVYVPLLNRDYEGEIKQYGDTVHINSLTDVTISTYTGTLSGPQTLTTTDQTLLIDQQKYFDFMLDDVDKVQAMPGLLEAATRSAAYGLSDVTDQFVAALLAAGGTAISGTAVAVTASNAYPQLVALKVALDKANVPTQGRWVVVPPDYHGLLLQDARFVGYGNDFNAEILTNGRVGRAAGFEIFVSNNVPVASSEYSIIAGHSIAATYAEQLIETEAMRCESAFGDRVRGLHVYGAKVTRPTAVQYFKATF